MSEQQSERINWNATFHVDILEEGITGDKLKKFLEKYEKVLCYKEVASKTKKEHYQGYIEFNDKKAYESAKSRWREYISSSIYTKGHKSFALERNEGRARIYVTKDRCRYYTKGYTNEELELFESQSYHVKKGPNHMCVYKIVEEKFVEWRNEWISSQKNLDPSQAKYVLITKEELFDFIYEQVTPLKPWDERQIASIFRWMISKYATDIEGHEYFHHNTKYRIKKEILGW